MEETACEAEALGYKVLRLPAVEVKRITVPGWGDFLLGLRKGAWHWVIFTSTIGVDIAAEGLRERGLLGNLARARIVAIGDATRRALEAHGLPVALVPPDTTSKGIVAALSNIDMTGMAIAILRSNRGLPVLVEALESLGALVSDIPLYHLGDAPASEAMESFLRDPFQADLFLFTSSLTVTNLLEAAGAVGQLARLLQALARAKVIALGRPTQRSLEAAGIRVDHVPPRADLKGLLSTTVKLYPPDAKG